MFDCLLTRIKQISTKVRLVRGRKWLCLWQGCPTFFKWRAKWINKTILGASRYERSKTPPSPLGENLLWGTLAKRWNGGCIQFVMFCNGVCSAGTITVLKGNWGLKFPFYIWKYSPWLNQKVMFSFDTCNAVAARQDRKPKYWWLGRRHLGLSLMSQRHTQSATWIDYVRLSNDFSGF